MDFNWFTTQLLIHSLYADKNKGTQKFINWGVEEVKGRFKKGQIITLLKELDKCSPLLSLENDPSFITAYENLQFYTLKYDKVRAKLEEKIQKADDEQKIQIYFLLSNTAVRQGEVSESLKFLEQAEDLNREIGDKGNSIRLDIELGWNYRLIGDFNRAKEKYEAAIRKILEETNGGNWAEFPDLAIRYGWTLNNLAFALSNSNETRRSAVNYAKSAIRHWQSINHELGLGAGYSVAGITYYRVDNYENALNQFGKAMEIFEKLELDDWICQVYSWRGATYQDKGGLGYSAEAEKDFNKALEIAEKANQQIVPMTLNRLGRVYMAKGEWERALETMEKSLQLAKALPDYFYWLGSIGRIALISSIAPEVGFSLEKIEREYQEFEDTAKERDIRPHPNQLGITKMALASLRITGLRDKPDETKVDEVIELLKEAIPLVSKYGSYARIDIESRLNYLEGNLSKIKPAMIRKVGKKLHDFITDEIMDHSNYIIVV